MNARGFLFILAVLTALGVSAACKPGSPTSPGPPPPPPPPPPSGVTFSGTVTSTDMGVAGIKILLTGDASRSTTTDGLGEFLFRNVSGTSFVITPWHLFYKFDPSSYAVGAQTRSDLNFTATETSESMLVGTTAPDFTGVDQNGKTVSLYSYRGKVIFIDICADWCGSCRAEAPQLEALYQAYKAQGLQVITVLTEGSAAEWAAQYNQTFPVIGNGAGIAAHYATGWVPVNIVIDRDMIIRFHQSVDYDEALFTSIIKSYL